MNTKKIGSQQSNLFDISVVKQLFNTITNKKVAVLGFAFKKDTGDTRESPAITVVTNFFSENAFVRIYDPKVTSNQINMDLIDAGVEKTKCIY